MVNFFDRWYSCPDNSAFLKRVRYYSLKRFLIRRVANILIPLYFRLSNFFFKRKLRSAKKETPKIIVSLTSFPLRIKTIWIVIECLMRQQTVPDKIILWLSKDQFSGLDALPKRLLNYRDRGLEIKLREGDLRSHKKYYYMLSENENDVLITVDDDLFYADNIVGDLLSLHKAHPKSVCCHRGFTVRKFAGELKPYNTWHPLKNKKGPSFDIFFTSGGGTLFPPGALHSEVLNSNIFTKLCFHADDVWLNIMSYLNHTPIIKSSYFSNYLPISISRNINLSTDNVGKHKNDEQINAVRRYYIKEMNVDPFFLPGRSSNEGY